MTLVSEIDESRYRPDFRKTADRADATCSIRLVSQLSQRLPGKAPDGPLVHRDGAGAAVGGLRQLVLVEDGPLEPAAVALDGDAGEVRDWSYERSRGQRFDKLGEDWDTFPQEVPTAGILDAYVVG